MIISELKQFLIDSNAVGYATDVVPGVKEPDGSTSITFEKGSWKSHDNFFGGEPYGGRLIVFYERKAVWMMVYYGWVEKGFNIGDIYGVLKNALKLMPLDYPFRGPEEYKEGDFVYSNSWKGEVDRYSGEEQISKNGQLAFKTFYFGGLVDE